MSISFLSTAPPQTDSEHLRRITGGRLDQANTGMISPKREEPREDRTGRREGHTIPAESTI